MTLSELLLMVEVATEGDGDLDRAIAIALGWTPPAMGLPYWHDEDGNHWTALPDWSTSIDDALGLVERVLPGWLWRLSSCSVSDDAWVCPDFNHPTFGADFQTRFNGAFGGRDPADAIIEITDVDRRPAGQPALALVQSALLGLSLSQKDGQ